MAPRKFDHGAATLTTTSPSEKFTAGYLGLFHFDMENNESVGGVLQQAVRDWLASRKDGADVEALNDWDGTQPIELPSGATIRATVFKDERSRQDTVRYVLTDQASDQTDGGLYRVTVLGAANPRNQRELDLMVQVSRNFGTEEEIRRALHPPALVSEMLDIRKIYDGNTRLQGRPRTVSPHDVDEVVEAVADQRRRVPIILGVSPELEADEKWRSIIAHLTANAAGTAAVYVVRAAAAAALNEQLPPALRTEPGHIRIVAPKVDFENPDMRRHPVWNPDEVTEWLDEGGRPTARAVETVVEGPRTRLLDFGPPPAMQRTMDLLDQKQREDEVFEKVAESREARKAAASEERAAAKAKAAAAVVEASGAPAVVEPEAAVETAAEPEIMVETAAVEAEVAVEASALAYPSRRERHTRKDEHSFWSGFKAQLAEWLGKPAQDITDQTVEADLVTLGERLVANRERLRGTRKYLDELRDQRIELQNEITDLLDDQEILEARLQAANDRLAAAEGDVERLTAQLAQHSLKPAPKAEQRNGEAQLSQLREKLQEVDVGGLDPRLEVQEALDLLRGRLGGLIQAKLDPYLAGRPWTVFLEVMDQDKGRHPGTYNLTDPAAQLRMLTERLPKLGHPFDEPGDRTVSTNGQSLRGLRHKWAHHYELDPEDPWRAFDATHQLLAALGDDEGAAEAKKRRDQLPRA